MEVDWDLQKTCKKFIKRGDTKQFAEQCGSYKPDRSDKAFFNFYNKVKRTLTFKRNKPTRLNAAVQAAEQKKYENAQREQAQLVKNRRTRIRLQQVKKIVEEASKLLEEAESATDTVKGYAEGYSTVSFNRKIITHNNQTTELIHNKPGNLVRALRSSGLVKTIEKTQDMLKEAKEKARGARLLIENLPGKNSEMNQLIEKAREIENRAEALLQSTKNVEASLEKTLTNTEAFIARRQQTRKNYEKRIEDKREKKIRGEAVDLSPDEKEWINAKIRNFEQNIQYKANPNVKFLESKLKVWKETRNLFTPKPESESLDTGQLSIQTPPQAKNEKELPKSPFQAVRNFWRRKSQGGRTRKNRKH